MKTCRAAIAMAAVWSAIAAAQDQAPDRRAQEAIVEIEALGGRVYRTPDNQVDIVVMTGEKVTDAHLELLQSLPTVRQLDLDGSQVTDAGLERLVNLPNLQEVSLRRTSVTKAAAAAFKDRHPGVYHVAVSSGSRPDRLAFAAVLAIPLGFGLWLVRAARRKRPVLSQEHYVRGIAWGMLLVVASGLLMLVAIAQAMGIDFHLADLFG